MNGAGKPLPTPSRIPEDVWFRSAGHRLPLESRPAILLKQITDRFTQHILCRAMLLQCHRADLVMDGRVYPHRERLHAASARWAVCLGLGLRRRCRGLDFRGESILE